MTAPLHTGSVFSSGCEVCRHREGEAGPAYAEGHAAVCSVEHHPHRLPPPLSPVLPLPLCPGSPLLPPSHTFTPSTSHTITFAPASTPCHCSPSPSHPHTFPPSHLPTLTPPVDPATGSSGRPHSAIVSGSSLRGLPLDSCRASLPH